MEHLSDEEIALLVQHGNAGAFRALVERYEVKLLRYGHRFLRDGKDVEDLVQETFLRAYTNIQSFDVARRFSPWLYRIAHNMFVNAIRKRGREPVSFFDPDVIFPHPTARETTDGAIIDRASRDAFDQCLDELPLKYREPFILRYIEDLDYQETAEILHIPVSTVGVRLHRARAMLKRIYEERQQHNMT
ncbi:RNA polymerase sigma factor [Candidatus Uhrbacteria bacterium]|nr:RNA polymerase sigma factor [Candidatus Uhrbacteria bacterium]